MAAAEHPPLSIPVGHRPALLPRAFRALGALSRALSNRRAMRRLGELSDHDLADIGLRRSDLAAARGLPLTSDPTCFLARRARERDGLEAAGRRTS